MRKFTTIIFFLVSLSVFSQNEKVQLAFDFLKEFQNVRDIAISQNQEEIYFTIQSNHQEVSKIAFSKKINNNWTKPELVSFSSAFSDLEPFLTTDGLRLYFASNRPLNNLEKNGKDYDIWYVERKNLNSEWSKPINIGLPINTKNDEFYPSVTKNKNIYFTSVSEKSLGKDDIFVSQFTKNSYAEPKNLGTNINSEGYEFNAYVSPEETFIIFTGYNRKDGNGSGDLYISYNKNGNWSLAENLSNAINSNQMDYCPFYDIKSNTLYFTSKRNSIQDKNFKSLDEFIKELSKVENGLSRIYKYNINF